MFLIEFSDSTSRKVATKSEAVSAAQHFVLRGKERHAYIMSKSAKTGEFATRMRYWTDHTGKMSYTSY